jgi:long-chain acyl-CoA synthetase
MADRTILDLYRHELERPRAGHYTHVVPGGSTAYDTEGFFSRTAAIADGLATLGIAAGDRVLVLCDNRPEWHMVDLAVLDLGAVNVAVYSTLTADQLAYQAADSGARLAVVENAEQAAKVLEIRARCPELRHVLQVEGAAAEPGVRPLAELWAAPRLGADGRFWDRAAAIDEDALVTIVYTSGTTGEPKGVMLTHRNIVTNIRESMERIATTADDYGLEFLPLCHMIERLAGYSYMALGMSRAYCSVYHVGELLATIRPTIFACVPRVLEKVHGTIHQRVAAAPPLRRALFRWALEIGGQFARREIAGEPAGGMLGLKHRLADRLVLSKVRGAFGGRLRGTISGGAALPVFVNEFFQALGIRVMEGYGLTETSPVIAINGSTPGTLRVGSVGRPLASFEVKLAADGELLARGPSVFSGYWNKPQQTAECFDEDGFFRTGDIARIDDDGFVFITDRKKDLIVTAGGKNVAPQPIESRLKQSPLVDSAVLIGDGRPYIAVLLSPSREAVEAWARENGLPTENLAALVAHPELVRLFARAVEETNVGLARFEQIKRFRVLPEMLSVEGGALTPTLKVKRRVVCERYAELVEGMYTE